MAYIQHHSYRDLEFQLEAFEIDCENRTAICPAGHHSKRARIETDGRTRIFFNRSTGRQCAFFGLCVQAKSKRATQRQLTVSQYYPYTRESREVQKSVEFRAEMRVRAQVEGTISEATRLHGMRHARYRGKTGHQLQFYLTGAAFKKRFVRRTTRQSGAEVGSSMTDVLPQRRFRAFCVPTMSLLQ